MTIRIAQLSCGTEYSGVQYEIESAARSVGAKIVYPDVSYDQVKSALERFGFTPKSPQLQLMIARAISLADAGKDVTILAVRNTIAKGANMFIKTTLDEMFAERAESIHVITWAATKSISERSVTYTNKNGDDCEIQADTVLYAIGSVPNSSIVEELQDWPNWESFRAVGDCTGASIVKKAIHQGHYAALDIL